ncbi:putative CD276 antigen-like, partial [Triplophysa rosa]
SCCFTCLWLIRLCAVYTDYAHVTVEGVIEGSAVLPCISNTNEHKPDDINVRWRHNGSLNVCDMTKGKCSVKNQDSTYKNRIQVISNNYEELNFSLKLNNLIHTDAGEYQCFITHSSELVKVQLLIKEKTEAKCRKETDRLGSKRLFVGTNYLTVLGARPSEKRIRRHEQTAFATAGFLDELHLDGGGRSMSLNSLAGAKNITLSLLPGFCRLLFSLFAGNAREYDIGLQRVLQRVSVSPSDRCP